MIEPVLPAAVIQALTVKAERPPIAVSVVSLPKALTAVTQPREIGGTVTQTSADGAALLHTAGGDIVFKAPVVLTPGRTVTLLLTPTNAGLAATLQVNGLTPPPAQPLNLPQATPDSPATTNKADAGGGQVPAASIRPGTAPPQAGSLPAVDQTSAPSVLPHGIPGALPLPPRRVPLSTGEKSQQSPAVPLPHGFSPAPPSPPRMQVNPGLRDAALLLSQLAVQLLDPPLPPAAVTTAPKLAEGKAGPPPAAMAVAPPAVIPNADNRPLSADPANLMAGLAAALKRPSPPADEKSRDRNAESGDGAVSGEAVYRNSGRLSEASENISWRQFQVMDDSRIVPVFLGRHPPEENPEEAPDQASEREPPARFTVRFDLEHAGSVRIDSVYRERRLDMLLTLDAAPDKEMQAILRERLGALSDEFGLAIHLRIGGLDSGPR